MAFELQWNKKKRKRFCSKKKLIKISFKQLWLKEKTRIRKGLKSLRLSLKIRLGRKINLGNNFQWRIFARITSLINS